MTRSSVVEAMRFMLNRDAGNFSRITIAITRPEVDVAERSERSGRVRLAFIALLSVMLVRHGARGRCRNCVNAPPPTPPKIPRDNCEAKSKEKDEQRIDRIVGHECLANICDEDRTQKRQQAKDSKFQAVEEASAVYDASISIRRRRSRQPAARRRCHRGKRTDYQRQRLRSRMR